MEGRRDVLRCIVGAACVLLLSAGVLTAMPPDAASASYWDTGTGVGSRYFWLSERAPGSLYYWKWGNDRGSHYYWKWGSGAGSRWYWEWGDGPGSRHFWEHGSAPLSASFWARGRDPGSAYFWTNGHSASFGPTMTALCASGTLTIELCEGMRDPVTGKGGALNQPAA